MSTEEEIRKTIVRFGNSFDLKDWALMESVLSEELTVDYSDLRGESAQESHRSGVCPSPSGGIRGAGHPAHHWQPGDRSKGNKGVGRGH